MPERLLHALPQRLGSDMGAPKIFGVGLSKTGTTSLANALQILGYSVRDNMGVTRYAKDDLSSVDVDVVDAFDALTDTPIPSFYRQLDALYPGSRFILTVRDTEGWLKSCKKQFTQRFAELQTDAHKQLFVDLYGTDVFEERQFAEGYERFVRGVEDYFGRRPDDLLIMDVTAGEGWEKLCRFLARPVPDVPFPKANVTRIRWMGVEQVVAVAVEAGAELMRAYAGNVPAEFASRTAGLEAIKEMFARAMRRALRQDGVKGAIAAADRAIALGLRRLNAQIPILSRVAAAVPFESRKDWNHLWMVDPLDGEDAFANAKTDFTIDIALIEDGDPIYGVVYAPALQTIYYSAVGKGAYKREGGGEPVRLASPRDSAEPTARSALAGRKEFGAGASHALSMCSALSLRKDEEITFGPTMEWQTAAAHAILRGVGRSVRDSGTGHEIGYNKRHLSNDRVNVA